MNCAAKVMNTRDQWAGVTTAEKTLETKQKKARQLEDIRFPLRSKLKAIFPNGGQVLVGHGWANQVNLDQWLLCNLITTQHTWRICTK